MTTATGRLHRFGELLRRHRLLAGLSQEELAERAGMSRRGISDLERGVRQSPHPATARRLSEALVLKPSDEAALLAAARWRSAPPPPTPAASGGPQLAQLASFIGREREVAAVRQLVASSRLLTLTGSGGIGKTHLALQIAEQFGCDWERAWFVDLAPLGDGALVEPAAAAVVGVRAEPTRTIAETLTDALQLRSDLLVLDNCEHVIHACSVLADRLLRACPHLSILATSREPLHIDGETICAPSGFDFIRSGKERD
jgi:transcriptional regulator with XRE-family HTH domain